MVPLPLQVPSQAPGTHLVLYDGVCGLCDHLVQFLLDRDHRAVFSYASLQSGIGKAVVAHFGRNPDELTSFYVVVNYRAHHARMLDRSNAALFVAGELGWPWKAAGVMRVLPKAMRDRAYDVVARTRYRLFGRFEQCRIPPPEFRRRFIDT